MATVLQKVVALEKRCGQATAAADKLGRLVGRAKCYLADEDLVLTASQKATLLEHYTTRLAEAEAALANIPPIFADFDPDPTEYENDI